MRRISLKAGLTVEIGHENHVTRIVDAAVVDPDLEAHQTGDPTPQSLEGIADDLDRRGALFCCVTGHIPHDDMANRAGLVTGIGHQETPEIGGANMFGARMRDRSILHAK